MHVLPQVLSYLQRDNSLVVGISKTHARFLKYVKLFRINSFKNFENFVEVLEGFEFQQTFSVYIFKLSVIVQMRLH